MRNYSASFFLILLFTNCRNNIYQPRQMTDEKAAVSGTPSIIGSLISYINTYSLSFQLTALLYEPFCEPYPENLTGLFRIGFEEG